MLEVAHGLEELGDLLAAEHHRESLGLFGEGDVLDHPGLAQANAVEETEGADTLSELRPGRLFGLDQEDLKGSNVLGSKSIRRLAEVLGKFGDTVKAREHLEKALAMYREMDMQHWPEQAEAALQELNVR